MSFAFLLGFSAKADAVAEQVVVALDGYELVIDDAVRLLSGRLKPEYTPSGVAVTGNVTLDELRAVFPGY